MTDDLKQKETQAWALLRDGFNGESLDKCRAAVHASIAAALAEALALALERVARLEELAQFPKLLAGNDALLQKMAAASPEGTLQHNPGLGSVTMSTEQAAALLKSSKPAASPCRSAGRGPTTKTTTPTSNRRTGCGPATCWATGVWAKNTSSPRSTRCTNKSGDRCTTSSCPR